MSADPVIDEVAREFVGFSLADDEEDGADRYENHCVYAQMFERWKEELLEQYVRQNPTRERLVYAKAFLADRYMEFRPAVPKHHRLRVGDHGHVCIWHVFERAYHQIRLAELALQPPLVIVPAPAPAPTHSPQLLGITLGEVLGEA